MYIQRHAEQTLRKLVDNFKVVLITGQRQVGKSTMLKEEYGEEYSYVTLDDINELEIAKNDPKLFFLNHPGKLIIDEVQYSPELFPEIKRLVDSSDGYGRFILTGSQTFSLMQNVSESLAGRIGIMELKALSTREILLQDKRMAYKPNIDLSDQIFRRLLTKKFGRLFTEGHYLNFIAGQTSNGKCTIRLMSLLSFKEMLGNYLLFKI